MLIIAAALIEFLQICLLLGLMGVVSMASLVPVVGLAAIPIGSILGMVITTCLSFMAAAFILPLVAHYGFWYTSKLWPVGIKVIPFVGGFVPTITIAVTRCVLQKFKDEHGMSLRGALKQRMGMQKPNAPASPVGARLAARVGGLPFHREVGAQAPLARTAPPTRAPLQTKSFDGIRRAASAAAVLLFFVTGSAAHAQTLPEPVQYVVSPEVPGPNQTVVVEVEGIGTFLGDSAISWQKDGKVVQSGAGLRTYSFVTGALGSVTTIRIDIRPSTGGSFVKNLVFRPSVVNLVWEADTSAPPLYGGKPLYSAGSPLKVAAFPTVVINGSRVAESSLSYQWRRGDQALPAQSGLGRNTLSFFGDQLQAQEVVDVDVYFGASLVARGGIVVAAQEPKIVLYERDSLRGVLYDSALPQAIALNAKEITVVAQPYHFDRAATLSGLLQYSWTMGGEEIAGPDSARGVLTLRQTGSGAGSATLEATLQNNAADQLVQSARTVLNILFGGQTSGSLFGL